MRHVVIICAGLALSACMAEITDTERVRLVATGCNTPIPTTQDVARMSAIDRMVFLQTQKAAQERVANAIKRDRLIGQCDAAWALAPQP